MVVYYFKISWHTRHDIGLPTQSLFTARLAGLSYICADNDAFERANALKWCMWVPLIVSLWGYWEHPRVVDTGTTWHFLCMLGTCGKSSV